MGTEFDKIKSIKCVIDSITDSASEEEISEKIKEIGATLHKENGHFTYKCPDKTKLKQGDVLLRTEALNKLLKTVHPYFERDQYKYFIILTQTCDLVQRSDGPKCRHITIAAVRSLEDFIQKELSEYQKSELEKKACIINKKHESKLIELVRKLYDNNHHDYFYLHEDPTQNFPSSVAFLRISIPLKTEHYATLLEAKKIQLREDFIAKLGWLVGDLYSRVGTQDWVPDPLQEYEFKDWVNVTVKSNCVIISGNKIEKLKKEFKDATIEDVTKEEILLKLSDIKDVDYKLKHMEELKKVITSSEIVPSEKVDELLQLINSSVEIMQCIKS
ncbi:MAG: hypothetical protein VB050_04870 [Geobacteraceae bacterium]|nr:hypothetical protein [Geobacteraceae bacterium]